MCLRVHILKSDCRLNFFCVKTIEFALKKEYNIMTNCIKLLLNKVYHIKGII